MEIKFNGYRIRIKQMKLLKKITKAIQAIQTDKNKILKLQIANLQEKMKSMVPLIRAQALENRINHILAEDSRKTDLYRDVQASNESLLKENTELKTQLENVRNTSQYNAVKKLKAIEKLEKELEEAREKIKQLENEIAVWSISDSLKIIDEQGTKILRVSKQEGIEIIDQRNQQLQALQHENSKMRKHIIHLEEALEESKETNNSAREFNENLKKANQELVDQIEGTMEKIKLLEQKIQQKYEHIQELKSKLPPYCICELCQQEGASNIPEVNHLRDIISKQQGTINKLENVLNVLHSKGVQIENLYKLYYIEEGMNLNIGLSQINIPENEDLQRKILQGIPEGYLQREIQGNFEEVF